MNTPEIILIPASDLLIDPELQARSRVEAEHVERLSRTDPKTWGPLVITPHPDQPGKYAILDGAHRFLAGQRLELPNGKVGHLTKYRSIVLPDGGYVESFGLNADHPLSLSINDRKAFARFLRENYPALSNREIARRAGMARRTVDGLFKRENESTLRPRNYIKQFVRGLTSAYLEGEAGGLFGLGEHRASAIVEAVRESQDIKATVKALAVWAEASQAALAALVQPSGRKDKQG